VHGAHANTQREGGTREYGYPDYGICTEKGKKREKSVGNIKLMAGRVLKNKRRNEKRLKKEK